MHLLSIKLLSQVFAYSIYFLHFYCAVQTPACIHNPTDAH